VFGSGGGQEVASTLSKRLGYEVPLLGQVPLDPTLRAAGDEGVPVTSEGTESAAGAALTRIAEKLAGRGRALAGRQLGLSPAGR